MTNETKLQMTHNDNLIKITNYLSLQIIKGKIK